VDETGIEKTSQVEQQKSGEQSKRTHTGPIETGSGIGLL
jgi:hypothetical protein